VENCSGVKKPAKTVNPDVNLYTGKRLNTPKRTFRRVRVRFRLSGICESCNKSFMSRNKDLDEALNEIQSAFDVHKCEHEDANQAAARIVREATERE
jgi:glutamine synthetase type III